MFNQPSIPKSTASGYSDGDNGLGNGDPQVTGGRTKQFNQSSVLESTAPISSIVKGKRSSVQPIIPS
jgi:hypothetical protein